MNDAKGTKKTDARDTARGNARRQRRSNRGSGKPAEWADANSELVLEVISIITEEGFAIQFGKTRDGGAFAVRIVGDGDPYNEYVRPTEDINGYLVGLRDDYRQGEYHALPIDSKGFVKT